MRIIDEDTVKYHGLNGKSEEYKEGYFDAMAAHDDAPTVINNIVKLRPKTDDVIVVSYNTMTTDFETLNKMFTMIQENLPDNKIIAIPDKVSMEYCDRNVLNRYIESIQEVMKNNRC